MQLCEHFAFQLSSWFDENLKQDYSLLRKTISEDLRDFIFEDIRL